MTSVSSDGSAADEALALSELLGDFEAQQRGHLLVAIDKAMKKQSDMLLAVRTQVEQRHRQALEALRDELTRSQPSLSEQLIARTLDVASNPGLVSWIDGATKDQALDILRRLRGHLESGQGNAFRSDFEALLTLYMEYLKIPMLRGSRLPNRIDDFYEALAEKASGSDDLINLVHRVRWGCFGVRAIGNARSHDATLLSEEEIIELGGCCSAIGAGMPALAREFEVCKRSPPSLPSDFNLSMNGSSGVDMAMLAQLTQAANGSSDQTPFDFIIQLMAKNGVNVNSASSPATFQGSTSAANRSMALPPGFGTDSFNLSSSSHAPPLPPGLSSGLDGLNLSSLNLNGLSGGFNGGATQAPSLSRLGSIGSTSSNSSQHQPPLPPGYEENAAPSGVWSQPPLPPSSGSPQKHVMQPPLPAGYESPLRDRSPHPLRSESPMRSSAPPLLPPSAESPQKRSLQPPAAGFAMKQADVPTQAVLALVPTFTFYYDRPTELPKESDRVRKAMFARMLNHMDELPKATLCPLQPDHDPTCPLSHTYMEVMAYNPLYKRLICRQPSHYWGSQIQEDESCVCVHVDTGLTWEWMDEARDKRMYCLRGSKCTSNKCIKSHSFEEMCWYNPSYKIKRCTVRAHEHVARARGTIAPPLDCSYYHIEEGKNADKREFTAEYDHVGKNVKMLFIERSHKPLADRLEALRYARANNL